MNNTVVKVDKFHQTKKGKLAFGAIELLLAYAAISLAIDSGSLWQYGLGIVLFIGGTNNLVNAALGNMKLNGKPKPKKR